LSRAASNSKKKTRPPTEQQREDVVEARRQWAAAQLNLDPDRVVFVDETWAKTSMTRT
jgi:selenocysteine lyase/cysteine desulfurase